MPSHDFPFLFVLAIFPAMFLAVILHEAGHVLAARWVGIDVAAWGVGFRRPWFYRRLGSSTFYLGRPLTGGMMIPLRPLLEHHPAKEFIMVVGGPLASALGLAIGLAAIGMGVRSELLVAWVYVSAIYVLLSSIPYTYSSKSLRLVNDAARLIHILLRGRECMVLPIGPALASTQALAELLNAIKCEAGSSYVDSSIACLQVVLGDVASARVSLAAAQSVPAPSPLSYYAHAAIAAVDNAEEADPIFELARAQSCGDATAEFSIACLHEQWRHSRGLGDAQQRQLLRQRAIAASRRDWLCWAEELTFEAEALDDVEARCREILQNFRRQLSGITRARLFALTAERLASQGSMDRAKVLFVEAVAAIAKEAASIASPTTREAYLLSAAEPLEEVAKLANMDPPNFDLVAVEPHSGRRRICGYAALILSVPAFVISVISCVLVFAGVHTGDSKASALLQGLAILAALLALVAVALSILRNERNRWRLLSIALALAFLVMAIAGLSLSQP